MRNPNNISTKMRKVLALITTILSLLNPNFSQKKPIANQSENSFIKLSGKITPRTEQFLMYTEFNGKKSLSSLLTREIQVVSSKNVEMLKITQIHESNGNFDKAVSLVVRNSLKPVSYDFNSDKQKLSLIFDENKVFITEQLVSGEIAKTSLPIDNNVFNNATLDEVIQSLNFKSGYSAIVRTFSPSKQLYVFSIKVTGTEKLITPDGREFDTWIVERQGADSPTVMWISKKTQELVKQRTLLKNGGVFWRIRLYG